MTAAVMSACAVSSFAQDAPKGKEMNPEQFTQERAERIADELALDDRARTKFIDTYCSYFKEMKEICPWQDRRDPEKCTARLSDKELDQAMRERLDRSRKMLDLKEKYYEEYSKFLNPRQIQKLYEMQRHMMGRHFHNGPHHDGCPVPGRRPYHDAGHHMGHGPAHGGCCPVR